MNVLKRFWPTTFKVEKGNVASLIIQLVIFLVVCAVVGWLIALLSEIPVIGVIFGLVGALFEIYGIVGIVLCVLNFLDVKLGQNFYLKTAVFRRFVLTFVYISDRIELT